MGAKKGYPLSHPFFVKRTPHTTFDGSRPIQGDLDISRLTKGLEKNDLSLKKNHFSLKKIEKSSKKNAFGRHWKGKSTKKKGCSADC